MNRQLTIQELQQAYDGLTIQNISSKEFKGSRELSRGPGTQCSLRFDENNENSKKVIYKYVDFKEQKQAPNIKDEADYSVPLINRQKYTQKIIDYAVYKTSFVGIYEYIEGEDLNDYMERRIAEKKPITHQEAAELCLEVWEILEPLHKFKVAHRNIKQYNIIKRKSDGKLILGDFSFGLMVFGKVHFGTKFTDRIGFHNLCFDSEALTDVNMRYTLDGNSIIMLFCQLLGKEMGFGYFKKNNLDCFIDMTKLRYPVPDFVVEHIKYLSLADQQGNRQPFAEALRIFSQYAKKPYQIQQQIRFEPNEKAKLSALRDFDYPKVLMIHPCSHIDDSQFYNYMQFMISKNQTPFEKIKIHFGGNNITTNSFSSFIDIFNNLNISKLKHLSINLNYNPIKTIINFVQIFEKTNLSALEKISIGFNTCQLTSEDVMLLLDAVIEKKFQNLKKLYLDLRGHSPESELITKREQELKSLYKNKINSKDARKRERYCVKV